MGEIVGAEYYYRCEKCLKASPKAHTSERARKLAQDAGWRIAGGGSYSWCPDHSYGKGE